MITSRYYYESLNQESKRIYKAIYNGIMQFKPYVEVPGVKLTDNRIGYIYHCVLWDNPYIFSIGEYAMYKALAYDGKKIKITTLCDANTEKHYRKEVEKAVNSILSCADFSKFSDFQKEVFVHDFLLRNVEYDKTLGNNGSRIEPYTVYGALVEKKAVCEGIAKTTKLLLNLLDVKCIVVSGTYDGQPHAWNMVQFKGFSYNLDVTMDMGRMTNREHLRYDYFNFRDSDSSHYIKDATDNLPICTAIGYNYFVKAAGYVSSRERLAKYIENSLKKKKTSLFFKINRNTKEGSFPLMTKKEFIQIIKEEYSIATQRLHISSRAMIDTTSPMKVVSMDIEYL